MRRGRAVVISSGHQPICFITSLHDQVDALRYTNTHYKRRIQGDRVTESDFVQEETIRQLLPHADGGWSFKPGAALLSCTGGIQQM